MFSSFVLSPSSRPVQVSLEEILGFNKRYVLTNAKRWGYLVQPVFHPEATDTCEEKAALLQKTHPYQGWTAERTIKAIYGAVDWEPYGFVFPELKQKITPEVVGRVFAAMNIYREFSSSDLMFGNSYIPSEMERGTCTPFASGSEMDSIQKIFVHDYPALDDRLVDISIGGKGEARHRLSLHLPYRAIYDILCAEYPEKIVKVGLFG
ncbi:hypothetical protein HYX14_04650 [Candidatus Woesearchaeota archaeon]|nr:hypothetical protein [Candidatus Woesearchaeota archaeon]